MRIPNRVALAPLAGIGNWFVRLQAKRYGAGLVVSEMVSSFAIHYRNERTMRELLRIHPDEHPVSVQLFGNEPDVMASAAEERCWDRVDILRRIARGCGHSCNSLLALVIVTSSTPVCCDMAADRLTTVQNNILMYLFAGQFARAHLLRQKFTF